MSGKLLPVERFDENARAALEDSVLRGALERATSLFGERREAAVSSLPEWDEWREQARRIKEETLSRLDHYLPLFEENATKAGARVHYARDGDEACRIVDDIARERGARRIVKSKSMTTEEIGLNGTARRANVCEPIETDLGRVDHPTRRARRPRTSSLPAIHKTRRNRSRQPVQRRSSASECTDDVDAAVRAFAPQDAATPSFANAETSGSVASTSRSPSHRARFLVLENEGNARMSTSLPKVHVAMMGIEKVIPKLADLEVFLRLLPRSGTGQHLTSYQSIITGVKRGPEDEGPEELHIVILDNGRSRMLAERVTRQSLACIRCGACLNACPVYRQIGGHAYGSVYPGPIGAVITPQLQGLEKASQLPYASSLCSACRDVCPVKIDIPEILLDLRHKIAEGDGHPAKAGSSPRPKGERRAFRFWLFAMKGPRRYRVFAALTRRGQRLAGSGGRIGRMIRRFAPALGAWTAGRELRDPAPRTFRDLWRDGLERRDKEPRS